MELQIFDNDDKGYHDWMVANPDGFVVNTSRWERSKVAVLHRSRCAHFGTYEGVFTGGYTSTGKGKIKVCSNDVDELYHWCRQHRPAVGQFSKLCADCDLEFIEPPVYADELPNTAEIFYEGARKQVPVNAYERNARARMVSLKHHGHRCKVCNLDFEERYGEIGKGFIHVHHIVPLAEIDQQYEVDPVNDLIPVCPNCHSMIHKRRPPFSAEELQQQLRP